MIIIDNLNLHYNKTAKYSSGKTTDKNTGKSTGKHKASTQVIFDLSLTINEGEKVAIIGPSGAGKSSLLHHLYQTLQSRAALCSQRQGLVDNLSIYHNVFMGTLARHHWLYNLINLIKPFKKNLNEITALCQQLELDQPLAKKVNQLSGGQRQRVALARALYQQQGIFIGDEPFSALDPLMTARLLDIVFAQHNSVIMVMHDRELAMNAFDRVIALDKGRLVLDSKQQSINQQQITKLFQTSAVA
ncbi:MULTISPECIES: ATP-binding cassette domain-containing protein [unclassified Colwellia]|uniref:ATP-binding cassette domain-containing protein n=1 Tax=unclassified Colwellia TaxID=196834 RepID=UPI0015F4CF5A|nr:MULTISPECIES: ATP-binding cassette domain-containing protein [unclassified Colwellia]MBA6233610.1 ATP-binding cassette domain-containing protein [Colwellia sp. MB02u-7]MBA6238170.1 ATP-binding cassette domain-containing protein [Colwellia sp. MB02u-11]MBA6255066.1 ATP-binding cassette domain-containing protein [Colwellia sp. MB3u-28]MBA6258983.1 ATP-binding cassette domain-containing protein [Colwellia sp. MB3u-41]MBA6299693.1 ATP-binding cassette domain-containing protein [Colwellia sp. MB